MNSSAMRVVRILLLVGAVLAAAWSLAIVLSGGFVVHTRWFNLSSRDSGRPLIVAAVFALMYFIRYREHWSADVRGLREIPMAPTLAAASAVAAVVFGIHWGTFIGGGPDASGYVSQADRWVHGGLTRSTPAWAQGAWWVAAAYAAAPVGYRPSPNPSILVPTYPPGLPLAMALFQRLGGREAVFNVVPLTGGLAIWSAYLLGRRLAGRWAGAVAAILLLSSPPFLWFVIQPMSDVPATAAWGIALALAWRGGTRDAIFAGIATAAAILIRPNLVPLALVPAMMLFSAKDRLTGSIRRLAAFAAAPACAAVFIAVLNASWYGSPLQSGYGNLSQLYAVDRIWPNIRQYAAWLIEWQTPLIALGFVAPLVVGRDSSDRYRVLLVGVIFPLAVVALYTPYLMFESWQFIRFLLPGFPAALAAAAAVLVAWSRRSRFPRVTIAAVVIIVAAVAYRGWTRVQQEGVLLYAHQDQRFGRAAEYAKQLPENAILVSLSHSGTLNFYAGRDTLRWDALHPPQLDRVLDELHRKGHPLFFVGDPFEADLFAQRFAGAAALSSFGEIHRITDLGGVIVVDLNR